MVLYSKFTYGSQFSEEKNGLEIRFLGPEILINRMNEKQDHTHPCFTPLFSLKKFVQPKSVLTEASVSLYASFKTFIYLLFIDVPSRASHNRN